MNAFWSVKVVPKYPNFAKFTNSLLYKLSTFILRFFRAVWLRDVDMYLVPSAFTSRPTSLLVSNRACMGFLYDIYVFIQLINIIIVDRKLMFPTEFQSPLFSWTFQTEIFKARWWHGGKTFPCFRPFWIGKASDKSLPMHTLMQVSFKHSLISLTVR